MSKPKYWRNAGTGICVYDNYTECEECDDHRKCRPQDFEEDDYDDDPNDAYHRWRDDRDMKEKCGYV